MSKEEQNIDDSLKILREGIKKDPSEHTILFEKDPLFRIFSFLGNLMGFKVKKPKDEKVNVETLSRACNIRYRTVELTPGWTKQDHGYLIGFDAETKKPLALIFKKNHYIGIHPSGEKEKVIKENRIENIAYSLYAPFPRFNLFRLLTYITFKGKSREFYFIGLIGFLMILVSFFFPLANKFLFDYIVPNNNYISYYQILLGFGVVVISSSMFLFMRSILILRINGLISNQVQMSLWDRILKLPVHFFRKYSKGDLLQRSLIFEQIRQRISENTLRIIFNSFFSILFITIMFAFSWQLSTAGISLIFLSSIFSSIIFIIKYKYDKKTLESNARIYSFLLQIVGAINKIRLNALESRIFSKWSKDYSYNQSLILKSKNLANLVTTTNAIYHIFLMLVIYSIVIIMQLKHPDNGPIFTVGTFLAFSAAFAPFSEAIFDLTDTLTSFLTLLPFWNRIKPILKTPIESGEDKIKLTQLKGGIKISNLSFRYHPLQPFILQDISLEIKPGEIIGLAGPSGCGKSTLCRILVQFEKAEKGNVYLDGIDYDRIDPIYVRRQIGLVLQYDWIFSGKLYDNITYGKTFSEEEVHKALELSTFIEDIQQLPMGLQTWISSSGTQLSNGQKQKLVLTRIFLQNPNLLILDEGLNSLDVLTRAKVFNNISELGVTRILVSHNIDILKKISRIYFIENGSITDSGTYDELQQKSKSFQKFIQHQVI